MMHTTIDSPWGPLDLVATEGALQAVLFAGSGDLARELALAGQAARGAAQRAQDAAVLDAGQRQLAEYAAGQRTGFDLPLLARGSDFQRRVWQALSARVAFGSSVSYGGLAALAGRPRAVRAVGNAVGANPWVIVVPCHRVLAGGGRLGGFSSGLERKRALLRHERIGWREP